MRFLYLVFIGIYFSMVGLSHGQADDTAKDSTGLDGIPLPTIPALVSYVLLHVADS